MPVCIPKRLYIEGHHVRKGYVVRLEHQDVPPVRYVQHNLPRLRALLERFNRRQNRLVRASPTTTNTP